MSQTEAKISRVTLPPCWSAAESSVDFAIWSEVESVVWTAIEASVLDAVASPVELAVRSGVEMEITRVADELRRGAR